MFVIACLKIVVSIKIRIQTTAPMTRQVTKATAKTGPISLAMKPLTMRMFMGTTFSRMVLMYPVVKSCENSPSQGRQLFVYLYV